MTPKKCPCCSGQKYSDCCKPFLTGQSNPVTPIELMRSRYTAFSLLETEYLIQTLAPEKIIQSGGQDQLRRELLSTMGQTKWLGLKVVAEKMDDTDNGTVQFIAYYDQGPKFGQLHERSRFVRQDGRWVYVDGEMLPAEPLSRNQPCVCGSGKKFKRCHGKGA